MRVLAAHRGAWVVGVVALAVAAAATLLLPGAGWSRWLVAGLLAGALAWGCWWSPRAGVLVTLGWLVLLGGTRRVVSWQLVDYAKDPLLLVGPAGLAALFGRAVADGAFRRWSVLSALVAVFSGLCLLAVANPDQESLVAGLAGLLFWLVPMVWFWVGRRLLDDRLLDRVMVLVVVAGVVSAVYGLITVSAGFPPWDTQWIRDRGYSALYVGGHETSRAFGVAASAVEFGLVVATGTLLAGLFALAALRRREVRWLTVDGAAVLVCVAALAVSGVRTAVAMLGLASASVLLIRLRPRAPVILGLVGLVLVGYAALWLVPAEHWTLDGTTGSVRRIVVGLRNPFDREDSTFLGHLDIVRDGLEIGFSDPLGRGPGSTNLAGERFSGKVTDTEFDVSNGAVAFGILGIVLTSTIFVVGMALAVRRAWRRPDLRHLAVLGVLILSFRFWWNGGHYFLSAVVWLCLGWLDAPSGRSAPPLPAEGKARARTG